MRACPHRPPCPGCPRWGAGGIAPAAFADLERLAVAHGVAPPAVLCGSETQFRLRARLAIRGRLGSPKLGLFESGTHRVVHIPNCLVHHPLVNHAASIVRSALVDARITCFSDTHHLGLARYLQVVIERSTQTAQLVLVVNSASPESVAECLGLIQARLGSDLHSLWFNANRERSNSILGDVWQHCSGPESVVERFAGAAIHYPPGAFGQNNLDLAERMVGFVRTQIWPGASVAEFYAGVGAIGLSILPVASHVVFNEASPHSLRGLELGMAQLSDAERRKIAVIPGNAGAACGAASEADVVIADPPRKGLEPELTAQLGALPPQRLIYISCGLESLLSDLAQLTATRKLRLTALTAFNLLPYTEHVETVACLERT